jgi:hypothetical protein
VLTHRELPSLNRFPLTGRLAMPSRKVCVKKWLAPKAQARLHKLSLTRGISRGACPILDTEYSASGYKFTLREQTYTD